MPFLSKNQIDPTLRSRHEAEYKARLRQALHQPGLSQEQKAEIRKQIEAVGKPKVYEPPQEETP